jgi:hypothetical protein
MDQGVQKEPSCRTCRKRGSDQILRPSFLCRRLCVPAKQHASRSELSRNRLRCTGMARWDTSTSGPSLFIPFSRHDSYCGRVLAPTYDNEVSLAAVLLARRNYRNPRCSA